MPHRRARAAALALLLASAGGLTACGAGSKQPGNAVGCDVDPPSKQQSVQVLAYSAPALDPFSDAMAQGCSKVKNLQVQRGQIDFAAQLEKAQLSLSQKGKGSYDIVEVYGGTLPQYAARGWLTPIDDLASSSRYDVSDIDPRFRKAFTYDGHLFALPCEVNVHLMVYRKDILSSLGISPPRTFDELVAAARKIKASGKVDHPLALTYGASSAIGAVFNNSLTSLGGRWVDSDDQPQLTSPQAVAAVESLKRLLPYADPDTMTFDQPQVQSQLQNGQAAIGILYSGHGDQFTDPKLSKFAGKFGFAAPPSVESGGGPWSTLNVDGFAVAENSAVPTKLLSQVAAVGTSKAAAKAAGTTVYPARRSVSSDSALAKKAPFWKAVDEILDQGVQPYPKKGYFAPMQTAVDPFLAAAVSGKTPVRRALQQAQDAAAKAVKQYDASSS